MDRSENTYRRDPIMVACILAVLVLGAAFVGIAATTGHWGMFGHGGNEVTFHFDMAPDNNTDDVALVVSVNTGNVKVNFEDNSSLLYRMTVDVPRDLLAQQGEPEVTESGSIYTLSYPAASVNITLGTAVSYDLDVSTGTGSIDLTLAHGASFGNVSLTTDTGGVSLLVAADTDPADGSRITLSTSTGNVNVAIDLPDSAGAHFTASTQSGSVDITTASWTKVTADTYESPDYASATELLTVTAHADVGSITGVLT